MRDQLSQRRRRRRKGAFPSVDCILEKVEYHFHGSRRSVGSGNQIEYYNNNIREQEDSSESNNNRNEGSSRNRRRRNNQTNNREEGYPRRRRMEQEEASPVPVLNDYHHNHQHSPQEAPIPIQEYNNQIRRRRISFKFDQKSSNTNTFDRIQGLYDCPMLDNCVYRAQFASRNEGRGMRKDDQLRINSMQKQDKRAYLNWKYGIAWGYSHSNSSGHLSSHGPRKQSGSSGIPSQGRREQQQQNERQNLYTTRHSNRFKEGSHQTGDSYSYDTGFPGSSTAENRAY